MEGSPEVSGECPFTDVRADWFYTDAITWAAENGIVNGISDDEFAPDLELNREQLAAMLYRYAAYKGYSTSITGDITDYADWQDVSDYAVDAMNWAVGNGIITGTDTDMLLPLDGACRDQIAAVITRYCKNIAI